MAETSSNGRGKWNRPSVPVKTSNSRGPYTANDQKASQEENIGSSTTVDPNGRPIVKPRNFPPKPQYAIMGSQQKPGILLPCFGEYQKSHVRPNELPTDSGDAVVSPMVTSAPKTPPIPFILKKKDDSKIPPKPPPWGEQAKLTVNVIYQTPIRTDKPKLPATKGALGTYRLLTPPPATTGKPPRKPAMPPNVDLDKFNAASRNFNEDLSIHHMMAGTNPPYDEAIYEVRPIAYPG